MQRNMHISLVGVMSSESYYLLCAWDYIRIFTDTDTFD